MHVEVKTDSSNLQKQNSADRFRFQEMKKEHTEKKDVVIVTNEDETMMKDGKPVYFVFYIYFISLSVSKKESIYCDH